MLKNKLLGLLIYFLYRVYFLTIKVKVPRIKTNKQFIIAHFHQDELPLIEAGRTLSLHAMTSTSKDGEIMTTFLKFMGYSCARGSSTRGGAKALLQLIKNMNKTKQNAVLAVDGPKGPIYKVKDGILLLAKKTASTIIPTGININKSFCFEKSWNKALLPRPFSTVEVVFGKNITVNESSTKEEMSKIKIELEKQLVAIKGEKI